jgi:hypothetical protein
VNSKPIPGRHVRGHEVFFFRESTIAWRAPRVAHCQAQGKYEVKSVNVLYACPVGTSQPNRTHTLVGVMKILAEEVNNLQAYFAMVTQEFEQFLALHQGDSPIIQHLGTHFVSAPRERGAKAKDLTGSRDAQSQALTRFGADRELGPAFAQHKNAPRALALMKQAGTAGVQGNGFKGIECFQSVGRQIAEEPVGAKEAIKAALV